MEKVKLIKLNKQEIEILAKFVKVARYARNSGNPMLATLGVDAETELEYQVDPKVIAKINKLAFS
jgi:hypothetical protein